MSRPFLGKLERVSPKSSLKTWYGISEIGVVGLCCKYLSKKYKNDRFAVYHPAKPVLIIDPDFSGVGEISVSTSQIPNYLTGDSGRLVKEKCKCGGVETLFLYGRINYDIVHCVGATFHISEVEKIFSSLQGYIEDYSLEIREIFRDGKTLGFVTIKIVPTSKLSVFKNKEGFIREFVQKNLQLTKTRTLDKLVRDGVFLPSSVVSEPKIEWQGKIIRMKKVDK